MKFLKLYFSRNGNYCENEKCMGLLNCWKNELRKTFTLNTL